MRIGPATGLHDQCQPPTAISSPSDRAEVEFAGRGEVLSQTFDAPGPSAAVHADLVGELRVDVRLSLDVVAQDGSVVASRIVRAGTDSGADRGPPIERRARAQ
jgi:hypothetical protein